MPSNEPNRSAREAAEAALVNAFPAASRGLYFRAYPRAVFFGLVAELLANTKRDALSLTLRELTELGEQAAHIHAEQLQRQVDAGGAGRNRPPS